MRTECRWKSLRTRFPRTRGEGTASGTSAPRVGTNTLQVVLGDLDEVLSFLEAELEVEENADDLDGELHLVEDQTKGWGGGIPSLV